MRRIIGNLALFAILFLAPWYFTAAAIFILNILFPKYWEGVVAALIMDSFYSVRSLGFYAGFGLFAFSAATMLFFFGFIRSKIRIFD